MNTQNTDELLEEISRLHTQVQKLKKRKRYGLVWEDKPELFDTESQNALPVLVEKGSKFKDIISDKDDDFNILIEGDNYHSLSVLKYTHRNKIDFIYADPPYNTGSTDWVYNNNYVDKEDAFRHSKWLSFMKKRLSIAKDLLKESGCIALTIDHYELFTIGMLMDEIFGESNRIGLVTIVIKPEGRQHSKFFSPSNEFMLVYAKNRNKAKFNQVVLDENKKLEFKEKDDVGLFKWKNFVRGDTTQKQKPNGFYPIYVSKDLKTISIERLPESYEVLPIDKKGTKRAWIVLREGFLERLENNEIGAEIDEDKNITILYKIREQQVFTTHWVDKKYNSTANGTHLVNSILGKDKFNFPKSLYSVIDTLKITTRHNATVLDFFAGSGTTGHAVLDLNKEDGGNRKFILCTNNENKICEEVTHERIKRVSQGYKNSKGEKVDGLGGNLKYLKTDFVKIDSSIDDLKEKIVTASTQILCLKESTFNQKDEQEQIKVFENSERYTAILFDTFYLDEFKKLLNTLTDKPISVYVFAYDKNFSKEEFVEIKPDIDYSVEPIPEKLLETYQEIFNF